MILEASDLGLADRIAVADLKLAGGTLTAVIGPNGSGKTSLLHAIAGIDEARGTVSVDGVDLRSVAPARRARVLSYLPARRTVAWPLRCRDLVALGGATDAQVDAAIGQLEVGAFTARKITELSTGERGRVLLARALSPRPRLLLLDEPTANLDLWWQLRLLEILRYQLRQDGSAALVAMHDIDLAMRFADRLLVMSGGTIVADAGPAEIAGSGIIGEVWGVRKTAEGWTAV